MNTTATRPALTEQYRQVRTQTEALCEPIETEDYVVQPMADASPPKWHLAHSSWFFETFVLKPFDSGYREIDPHYAYLFNSYYVQAGERHRRDERGMATRPTVRETYAYRAHVDEAMRSLLARGGDDPDIRARVILGLHHEQQHQELLLTDLKYALSKNPLKPVYRGQAEADRDEPAPPLAWRRFDEGVKWIGFEGEGFCFDNETPRHRQFVHAFELAARPATNSEYLEFVADGGYRRPELWLSDGWAAAQAGAWKAPLYWEPDGTVFTLAGMRPLEPEEPVCHVSYYEADAFARWCGLRLPTEAEWELAAGQEAVGGNFLESGRYHPAPARTGMYGDIWVWTMSDYSPYPGYRPAPGALGEYNGKFMVNQRVLRGGSCATPRMHMRPSYRNFFHPDARWQFTGIRLAREV